VIDIFDPAFSSDFTLEGQKKDILSQLTEGQRPKNSSWKILKSKLNDNPNNQALQKECEEYESKFTPCRIISETTEKINGLFLLNKITNKKKLSFFMLTFVKNGLKKFKILAFLLLWGLFFHLVTILL